MLRNSTINLPGQKLAAAEIERLAEDPAAPCELAPSWELWVADLAVWKSFITLTVSNEKWCSREVLLKRFRCLVQILNRDLFGKHYVRIVGHSYFSYVVGVEFNTSGGIHLHVLVDRPVNFELIHTVWNSMSGWAYIKPITEIKGVAKYICKYVVKRQDLEIFVNKKIRVPKFIPMWFMN